MESPARVIASQAIPARGGRYPRNSLEPGSAKLNFGPWIAVPNLASGTMDFSGSRRVRLAPDCSVPPSQPGLHDGAASGASEGT
jgi:hypothetical protein